MPTDTPNAKEAAYWSSDTGRTWIDQETALDAMHQAVLDRMLELSGLAPGHRVLDIGCGAGASALAAARRVGPTGEVLALDISEPLLDRTRERIAAEGLENAAALLADAQVHPFEPGRFDRVISRFGTMFFADSVAAFANIARAVAPGGRICFACWGPPALNPHFSIPRKIATDRLGEPPPGPADVPGPMRFADPEPVAELMRSAGLRQVEALPEDLTLVLPGTARDMAALLGRVGTAVRVLRLMGGTEEDAAAIATSVEEAFRDYETPGGVAIPARVNFFLAAP